LGNGLNGSWFRIGIIEACIYSFFYGTGGVETPTENLLRLNGARIQTECQETKKKVKKKI
jgi:hypothetical protein